MALVSYKAIDVIFRDLDDVIVIKNVRCNEMMTLENVSADIWRFLAIKGCTEFMDIVAHISNIYDVEQNDIIEDIEMFIEELYQSGIVSINGEYNIPDSNVQNDYQYPQEDFEGRIMQLYQEKGLLYSVTFELTYSCNEKCVHCYANYPQNSSKERKPTLNQLKQVIDELYRMKCMHITFTGGDPFMFTEFVELFEYTRNMGFSCDIFTNAVYLADHTDTLNKILSLRPQAFFISLYGADAENHESITTIPGTFNKTITAIKAIRQADIPVILNVMLLKSNVSNIENTISLANKLNVEYRVGMSLIYKNDGSDSPMNYFIDDKDIIKRVLMIEKERFFSLDQHIGAGKGEFFCGAARTSLAISPDGTVYPCVSLKNPMGNIFDDTITAIWHSEKRKDLLSKLSWDNVVKCKECEYVEKCPHCIGISQSETGDMFSCNTCDRLLAQCLYEIDY